MALYKGNRESTAPPAVRRSALRHRGPAQQGGAEEFAPPESMAPAEQQEDSPHQQASANDEGQPGTLADIPLPQTEPLEAPAVDTSRRVLGRTRTAAQVPSHLAPYQETIVIGGDPRRQAPAAPQYPGQPQSQGGMEQTMATPSAPPPPAPDKEIIARAQMEAQQIIQQAQMQAQQVMQEAQAQINEQAQATLQQAGEQGYQEGTQQGFAAGQEQGMAETVQRVEQLKMEFVELVLARRKVLARMETEIVHLAIGVAEKIVGMELSTGRDIIAGIVRQGLATLKERDEVIIRVNPAEVDAVRAHQTEYETMVEGLKRLEVISDGAIEPGSCSIETNLGNVDARINTQFEAVRQGLDELCKIRAFEMKDKMETTPVEVPGDPEFHAKILEAELEAKAAAARAAAGQH